MTRPTTVSTTSRRKKDLGVASSYQELTCQNCVETQCTRYDKLTQTKSGQAAEKSTERQAWLKDSLGFLRGHIRRKGVSKSSMFKSPQRPSAATASIPDTSRDTESEMEISVTSDVNHQPLSISPK